MQIDIYAHWTTNNPVPLIDDEILMILRYAVQARSQNFAGRGPILGPGANKGFWDVTPG